MALFLGFFNAPILPEDHLIYLKPTQEADTIWNIFFSLYQDKLGKFAHIPFYILIQSTWEFFKGSVYSLNAIYFLFNLGALILLHWNLRRFNLLSRWQAFFLCSVIATAPMMLYSFFKLETFLMGFFISIGSILNYQKKHTGELSLIFAIATLTSEISVLVAVACSVCVLIRGQKLSRVVMISLPSILLVALWIGVEIWLTGNEFSLNKRAHPSYMFSFSTAFTVYKDYFNYLISNYGLHIIVVGLALIYRYYQRLSWREALEQIKPLTIVATFIAIFFFYYSHFHPKDMIGIVMSISLAALVPIYRSGVRVWVIVSSMLLVANTIYATVKLDHYNSPLIVAKSIKLKEHIIDRIEKNGFSLSEISVGNDLKYSLKGREIISLGDARAALIIYDGREYLDKKLWCPIYIIRIMGVDLMSEDRISNCTLSILDRQVGKMGEIGQYALVLYQKTY